MYRINVSLYKVWRAVSAVTSEMQMSCLKRPDLNLVLGCTPRTLQATVMCCEFRMFCSRLKVMGSEVQEGKVLQNLCRDTAMAVELVRTTFMTSLHFDLPIVQFSSIAALAPSQKRMHINFARLE